MKERPILMSAPMVRAILYGTKTQTRRVVKPQRDRDMGCELAPNELAGEVNRGNYRNSPYTPGDRLWVREAWRSYPMAGNDGASAVIYRADEKHAHYGPWKPSIHMPRYASRILLEIVSVRVERLNDISGADARAEGCPDKYVDGAEIASMNAMSREWYAQLWESINGPGAWAANPWVWVVEFRRIP